MHLGFIITLICLIIGIQAQRIGYLREEVTSSESSSWFHRLLSLKADWFTSETISTYDGEVPRTSCPVGKYRVTSGSNLVSNKGLREDGCIFCPRGKFGSTTGLSSALCTGSCPKGRYSDRIGLTTANDCKPCAVGRYGSSLGLTTAACTASCATGYYTSATGSEASTSCIKCPTGFSAYPCGQVMNERETRNSNR
jgi:hypothetical protein